MSGGAGEAGAGAPARRHVVDVAVVGARVAGSVLATLLGEAGLSVLVLDREPPDTDTLSTHYTTGAGMVGVLRRLGVLEDVLRLGTPPLVVEYRFYGGAPDPVVIPQHSPGDIGYALSVRRRPLDAILWRRAARTPGVELHHRTRVTGLLRDDRGAVCGLTAEGPDGPLRVEARLVVGADGRHSSVARWVDAPYQRRDEATRSAVFRYVRGYRGFDGRLPDGSEFALNGDEALYAFPSDDDTACVALSVPTAVFQAAAADLPALFASHLPNHPSIARRVAATSPVDDGRLRGTAGTANWIRVPVGAGWALVGDAGAHLDPWTGRGMDFASTHAVMLADAIVTGARHGDLSGHLGDYHAARDEAALGVYDFTVINGRNLAPLAAPEPWGITPLPGPPPGRYPTPATSA
ncbi:MAG: NAD(P)/FAD-dependent oxidoreductase [Chloroflexota bacterium]